MPEGAITCGKLNLNDGFIAGLNRGDRQVLIVFQRQEGGYWLMPIGSATLIAKTALNTGYDQKLLLYFRYAAFG